MATKKAAAAPPAAPKTAQVNVPIDPLNKDDKILPVLVNGEKHELIRGEWNTVPIAVACALQDSDISAAIVF